jgi:hypothetical protein
VIALTLVALAFLCVGHALGMIHGMHIARGFIRQATKELRDFHCAC